MGPIFAADAFDWMLGAIFVVFTVVATLFVLMLILCFVLEVRDFVSEKIDLYHDYQYAKKFGPLPDKEDDHHDSWDPNNEYGYTSGPSSSSYTCESCGHEGGTHEGYG